MLDLTPGSGKLHITQLWSWKVRRGNFILDPWSLQDPSHWYLCWWWWWLLGTVGNGPSAWVWNDYDVSIAFVKNIYGFRMWWTISDAWRWEKIGKHIRSHNIHIQPKNTFKVEMIPNQIPTITHWYQLISLVSLLMVMVSPRYSWEWSILMGLKWCSDSICGEFLWFQDVVNHYRPMKMRKSRKNISGHITYTSNPKIPWKWEWFQIKYPLVSTHINGIFVDGDGFSSV